MLDLRHPERCGSYRARRRGAGLHRGPWGDGERHRQAQRGRTPKARPLPLLWAIRGRAVGGAGVMRFAAIFPPSCPRILGMAPLYILWTSCGGMRKAMAPRRKYLSRLGVPDFADRTAPPPFFCLSRYTIISQTLSKIFHNGGYATCALTPGRARTQDIVF